LALAACGTGPRHPAQAGRPAAPSLPPAASSPARPADLKRLVLGLGDLPPGFVARPLTSRNLPSDLTGCAGLQQLTGDSIGRHEQAEFFRPPIGPWIDEAVIAPASRPAASGSAAGGSAGGTAARLTAALARAIARCSSVTVTEEGYRVTLALAPAPAPASAAPAAAAASAAGREAHAYRATGALGGIPLEMDIVLTRVGGVVLLLTNTSLGGTADPALTATAVRAAAARAARA